MLKDLIVINRYRKVDFTVSEAALASGTWLHWKTCVRQMLIGLAQSVESLSLDSEDQVHRGESAYQYCLEVICGLHSPIVGETEVYGQFKKLSESYALLPRPSRGLAEILRQLDVDTREVRRAHLYDLGSQSYGSVVRRLVKRSAAVHFVGAGLLAKDVLPWVAKMDVPLTLHCRQVDKAQSLLEIAPQLKIHALTSVANPQSLVLDGALIVAAPIEAATLQAWCLARQAQFSVVIDLRGEAEQNPLNLGFETVTLQEIFAQIEKNKQQLANRVAEARAFIRSLTAEHAQEMQVRPFGWEDLCA